MQCKKLKSFLSVAGSWKILSCQAARLPYVPSIEELEKFCSGRQHHRCRIYHNFLREEMSSSGPVPGQAADASIRQEPRLSPTFDKKLTVF